MYRATKDLMINRQSFSQYPIKQVFVEYKGGGVANDCFKNAIDTIDEQAGISVVSGWLVWKYLAKSNKTVINQHYWNADKNGKYFDTTPLPLPSSEFEYVIDMKLARYGQENHESIKSSVCYSLLYSDGEYVAYEEVDGKPVKHKIENLSEKNIFKFK
jgi:hypothetical protein